MFIKAKLALRRGVSFFDKFKLLILAAYSSRENFRFLSLPLIKMLSRDGKVNVRVKNPAKHSAILKVAIRIDQLDSDYLSLSELVMFNCYRLPDSIQPDLIIDGGGNTGLFSSLSATIYPKVPIWIFEPVKENIHLIKYHNQVNNVKTFTLYEGIISLRDGPLPFYVRSANSSSFKDDEPFSEKLIVNSHNLVSKLSKANFENLLVKLDIEGAEVEVIPDLISSLNGKNIIIIGELHKWPDHLDQLNSKLDAFGYKIETYEIDSVCLLFRIYK